MMSLGYLIVKHVFAENLDGTMIILLIKDASGDRNMSLLSEPDEEATCHMNHRPKHIGNR